METSLIKTSLSHLNASLLLILAVLLSMFTESAYAQQAATVPKVEREWTVLVYMNGKNNLEQDALDNFYAMKEVGSTDSVAIVAQLGRPKKHYTTKEGNWSGVYRFNVKTTTRPVPSLAISNVADSGTTDMGKPAALREFIRWGKKAFPAKKFMVIIWNHGQGWRFQLAKTFDSRLVAARNRSMPTDALVEAGRPPALGGYRAISSDDDTGSLLYNRQVQDVIASEFATKKLDVLGYDACLMAMMETAYGLTPYVETMVGSEELEPGAGWPYDKWLKKLVDNPSQNAEQLSAGVVEAYGEFWGNKYETTLSALRLKDVRASAKELSKLSDALRKAGTKEWSLLLSARQGLQSYGGSAVPPLRTSVDLITLLKTYEKLTSDQALVKQSTAVRASLASVIIKNYASTRSISPPDEKPFGSEGIAIYFPESLEAFREDYYNSGYRKKNDLYPVEFVKNETWADLLYKVLEIQ